MTANMQFTDRAMAVDGVMAAYDSIEEVELIGAEEDQEMFDVIGAMRLTPDSDGCMILTAKHIIAGGLLYDEDCESPLESCDGEGKIYHAPGRRSNSEEGPRYLSARGLDEHGDPLLDGSRAIEAAKKHVKAFFDGEISILLKLGAALGPWGERLSISEVEELIMQTVSECGAAEACNRMAAALEGEDSEKVRDFGGAIDSKVIDELTNGFGLMEPMAVLLDIYEHSGVSYSVSGGSGGCQWDTSRGGAVWVPDSCAKENIEHMVQTNTQLGLNDGHAYSKALQDAAVEYCKGILENYNDWCNGSNYGRVVYVFDRETGEALSQHDDECWGFIGHSYAVEELHDTMLSVAAWVIKEQSETPVQAQTA